MSVGPTRGPVQRPDLDRDLTEIFQRLEDLERIAPGIACQVLNVCEWFSLTTTGEIPTTDQGIELNVTNGKDFDINMVGGGTFSASGGTGSISAAGSTGSIGSSGATWKADNDGITSRLQAGKRLRIEDSVGNPILEMTEGTSDLHLPTGGNVIFDL